MGNWTRRAFVFYPDALVGASPELRYSLAKTFADTAGLETLASEMGMFETARRLTAANATPYRVINTALTEVMVSALVGLFAASAGSLPGVAWFVVDADTSELLQTNTPVTPGMLLTYDDAQTFLGLTPETSAEPA